MVGRRVVIESPYAGDPETVSRHLAYLRRCLRDSILRGESPIASHGLYAQPGVLDDTVPAERKLGIECGYEWYGAADAIVFCVDLGWSPGMRAARERAETLEIPTEVRSLEELPW